MTKEENKTQEEMIDILQKMSKKITKIETKLNKLTSKDKQTVTDEQCLPIQNNNTNSITNIVGNDAHVVPHFEGTSQKNIPKLIISEKTKQVQLPYTEEDIEYYKQCGYETEEEIAERFFTVPLQKYQNFAKSRIRERI